MRKTDKNRERRTRKSADDEWASANRQKTYTQSWSEMISARLAIATQEGRVGKSWEEAKTSSAVTDFSIVAQKNIQPAMQGCRSRATPCLPHSAGANECLIWMKKEKLFESRLQRYLKLLTFDSNSSRELGTEEWNCRSHNSNYVKYFLLYDKKINGNFFL